MVLSLLGLAPDALAQTPVATTAILQTAEQACEQAVYLLERGRRTQLATEKARLAVQAEPDNFRYQVVLACAMSARACFVGRAATEIGYRENAPKNKDFYLQAFGVFEVDTEPVLTKDDGLTFTLTHEQGKAESLRLAETAIAQWQTVISKAKTDEERAEAYNLRGWWVQMFGWAVPDLHPHLEKPRSAIMKGISAKADFLKATELAPERADYWRAYGDFFFGGVELHGELSPKRRDTITHAYETCVRLDRRNADIYILLHELWLERDTETAAHYLEQALRYDQNRRLWIAKATFDHKNKRTGTEEDGYAPVEAVEQAARCTRTHNASFSYRPPRLVFETWNKLYYHLNVRQLHLMNEYTALVHLADDLEKVKPTPQNADKQERVGKALITIGRQIAQEIGNEPELLKANAVGKNFIGFLPATSINSIFHGGYRLLKTSARNRGSEQDDHFESLRKADVKAAQKWIPLTGSSLQSAWR